MEKKLVGRPRIFKDINVDNYKTYYMMNRSCYCDICDRDYKMNGISSHKRTKKHQINLQKKNNELV